MSDMSRGAKMILLLILLGLAFTLSIYLIATDQVQLRDVPKPVAILLVTMLAVGFYGGAIIGMLR